MCDSVAFIVLNLLFYKHLFQWLKCSPMPLLLSCQAVNSLIPLYPTDDSWDFNF